MEQPELLPKEPTLRDISTRTKEGKMLFAAVATLTTQLYTNETPDGVIARLYRLSNEMFENK